MPDIIHDKPTNTGPDAPAGTEQLARQQAIRQIERRRRFRVRARLVSHRHGGARAIWAVSEYHNAGGWPTGGFSQSSGIPDVWNYWIIYPLGAWVLLVAAGAWGVYRRKPISEDEIKREIERPFHQPTSVT